MAAASPQPTPVMIRHRQYSTATHRTLNTTVARASQDLHAVVHLPTWYDPHLPASVPIAQSSRGRQGLLHSITNALKQLRQSVIRWGNKSSLSHIMCAQPPMSTTGRTKQPHLALIFSHYTAIYTHTQQLLFFISIAQ